MSDFRFLLALKRNRKANAEKIAEAIEKHNKGASIQQIVDEELK